MQNNTFEINGWYIGEVRSSNSANHQLEVFVPRLTPLLNHGFSPTTYNTGLETSVIKSNTLIAKPYDYKDELPSVGSLVRIMFIGDDIKRVYWMDFDPYGTNKYIPFEMTDKEKMLDNFYKSFDIELSDKNDDYDDSKDFLVPKDRTINLGRPNKHLGTVYADEFNGSINVGYVDGLNDVIESINKTFTEVGDNLSGFTTDLNTYIKKNEEGKQYLTSWKDSGTIRDADGHESGSKIFTKSLSLDSFGNAEPGISGEKRIFSYNLVEIDKAVSYFNVKGNIKYTGSNFNIGHSYTIHNGSKYIELNSGVYIQDEKLILTITTTDADFIPESGEFIIELSTVDNSIPSDS